jgi:hypothetical protein
LGVLAILGLSAACGGTRYNTFFVEPGAKPYWRALVKPVPYPLARTLTWKYRYTADKRYGAFVADGKIVEGKAQLKDIDLYAAQPVTVARLSEVYALRAREATASGRLDLAETYNVRSENALKTEIASQRVEAGVALGNAMVGFAEALVKWQIDEVTLAAAKATAAYFTTGTPRAVIGDQAPPGTVLELYFRLDVETDGWDPLIARRRFEVVATLLDADGKLWRAAVGVDGYLVQASKPTVPPALDEKNVLVNGATFIPFRDPAADYLGELGEIGRMQPGTMFEHALAGAQAIQDLYEQIEAAKTTSAP